MLDKESINEILDIINEEPSLPEELKIAIKPREEIEKSLAQQGIKIIVEERKN